eukprot:2727854-Rhodomonas_salina.1
MNFESTSLCTSKEWCVPPVPQYTHPISCALHIQHRIGPHFPDAAVGIAMCHHLAHLAREAVLEARGWSTSREKGKGYSSFFHRLRSSYSCCYGSRLATALCKALGQQGLVQADQVRAGNCRHADGDDLSGWD